MRAGAYMGIAGPQGVGAQRIPVEYRAGVDAGLAPEIQAVIYIQHGRDLEMQARQEGLDPATAFPPPPPDVLQRVQEQLMGGGGNRPGQPPAPGAQPGTQRETR